MVKKYSDVPKHLRDLALTSEKKEKSILADQMTIQAFLIARQKYRSIMVPFEFKIGDGTLQKNIPCRLLNREEQNNVLKLQVELMKVSRKLNNPPTSPKALKNLTDKSQSLLDQIYQLAEDICLDPTITFKFFKENNITLDVPLNMIMVASTALNKYASDIPKFRDSP